MNKEKIIQEIMELAIADGHQDAADFIKKNYLIKTTED